MSSELLEPFLESMLKCLCDTLTIYNNNQDSKLELTSVTNNASWCIGQIALKTQKRINISLEPIYKELTIILS
jgi:hypothetical protein